MLNEEFKKIADKFGVSFGLVEELVSLYRSVNTSSNTLNDYKKIDSLTTNSDLKFSVAKFVEEYYFSK